MKADLSLITLLSEASLLVQLVMLVLLLFSILSWSIIIQRGLALFKARKWLNEFEDRFHRGYDLNQLYDYLTAKRHLLSGIEAIFKSGLREFLKLYNQDAPSPAVMEGTEKVMRVAMSREEQKLESNLSFLSIVGSISVYIGLFGTVWGIMTAFRALGQVQQATLAMVAPGISEALVATALGLFAAIPAVYAYNRYTFHVEGLMRRYDDLAEEFTGILHRRLHSDNASSDKVTRASASEHDPLV